MDEQEHSRSHDPDRCTCGGAIVFYECGESSGCEVAGRPFIYARFMDNTVLADGELYGRPDWDE